MTNLILTAVCTAYVATSRPCANGRMPVAGVTVAVPRNIPLGSTVIIDGHQYRADDHTALRYNGRFDIFMSTRHETLQFGKQTKKVIVYERTN